MPNGRVIWRSARWPRASRGRPENRDGSGSDYTHDSGGIGGIGGTVSAASPRWLRLTRAGATITGYDSTDGTHWTNVGSTRLAGLPATVPAGLFAASPDNVQFSNPIGRRDQY